MYRSLTLVQLFFVLLEPKFFWNCDVIFQVDPHKQPLDAT